MIVSLRSRALTVTVWFFIACLAMPVTAQEESDQELVTDTFFEEIYLNEDGVFAVDTAGNEYRYDFDLGDFTSGSLPSRQDGQLEVPDELTSSETPIHLRCTEEKIINRLKSNVTIGYEEYVDGDIIAMGRVTVKGWVKGDVRSIKNKVYIAATGRVDGSVEAPEVVIKDGGIVSGIVNETGDPLDFDDLASSFSVSGILVVVPLSAFLILFSFLVVSLMPGKLTTIGHCMSTYKIRSSLLGFILLVLMPVLMALVMITIIGLVLVPIVLLAYVAAIMLGAIWFGCIIGRTIATRFLGGEKNLMFQTVLGTLLYMSLWFVVAILMGSTDDVSEAFGIVFLVLTILISIYPLFGGLGAVTLTRFGFKSYRSLQEQRPSREVDSEVPAPPPIPQTPELPENPVGGEKPEQTEGQ